MSSLIHRSIGWMRGLMQKHLFLMMTCREFEDFMVDYFEGGLSERQKFVFDLHMKMCRECREYLAAYRRTIEVEKAAFKDADAPVPEDVPEDLVQAILKAREA